MTWEPRLQIPSILVMTGRLWDTNMPSITTPLSMMVGCWRDCSRVPSNLTPPIQSTSWCGWWQHNSFWTRFLGLSLFPLPWGRRERVTAFWVRVSRSHLQLSFLCTLDSPPEKEVWAWYHLNLRSSRMPEFEPIHLHQWLLEIRIIGHFTTCIAESLTTLWLLIYSLLQLEIGNLQR